MNFELLTKKNAEYLQQALLHAKTYKASGVDTLHFMKAALDDVNSIANMIVSKLNVDRLELIKAIDEKIKSLPSVSSNTNLQLSRKLLEVFEEAETISKKNRDSYLSFEHVLVAIYKTNCNPTVDILKSFGMDLKKVEKAVMEIKGDKKVDTDTPEDLYEALNKYGRELVELVRIGKIDPIIGRDEEIRRIMQILSRKTKNNPILIGDPGVGKTAVIEGLAWRIFKKDVPTNLLDKKIFELDITALVAGAKYRGEFEERLKTVLNEIKKSSGEIILFIDEIHLLVGAGKTDGAMDAANILKPMLARGELHCIGATTLDEYRKYIEKDKALERRMQQVLLKEPTVEDTISILRGLKERFETHHGVKILDSAIVSAATLSNRYITNRFLPDKAIDLIDEGCAKVRLEIDSLPVELDEIKRKIMQLSIEAAALKNEEDDLSKQRLEKIRDELKEYQRKENEFNSVYLKEKDSLNEIKDLKKQLERAKYQYESSMQINNYEEAGKIKYYLIPELDKRLLELESKKENNNIINEIVNEEIIEEIISKWTSIPLNKLKGSEVERVLDLDRKLKERVVGQDEAINLVYDTIKRSKAMINDSNRPIGSFMFLGPTGVGKTEVAKALALNLYGSENKIIRLDMSEYMEKFSASRLLGAPPGYVGYDEGGQLSEAVRRNPYSLVLFDEIEKADKEVFNILLQILDEGFATDSHGVKIDFRNTIIIMTSNLGANLIMEKKDNYLKELDILLKHTFKPEFINRIDEIIYFNSLTQGNLEKIITKFINELNSRLTKHGITISLTSNALKEIESSSYDTDFGARPIKRFIQKHIESLVADQILKNKIGVYKEFIIDFDGLTFTFNHK